jgi:hypothetical protein
VELAVNDAVGASQATVSSELRDIRRILADDMEAANEATAVFGRLLAKLGDRLEAIEETLRRLETRLESQEAARPAPAAPPPAPPVRRGGKSRSAPATPAPADRAAGSGSGTSADATA